MAKVKQAPTSRGNDKIRRIMLEYFYNRNAKATSSMGKKGSAVKISDIKAELKVQSNLSQPEVQCNLTYLLSQGWVTEIPVEKEFQTKIGTTIPSVTKFYQITAAGIDKIEGPGEFTMPKFHGIKIEATGQNIITLGDGNQINAKFSELGQALADLRESITNSKTSEAEKMNLVADIDTIQSQLAKPQPNVSIIRAAWEMVKGAAAINGCLTLVSKAAGYITPFIS